jgi:histidinol phosphatase-like enzyme
MCPSSALFLDRDGVINVDHGYVHGPDQFEFVLGIFPLARFWADELRRPIVSRALQELRLGIPNARIRA